MFHPYSDKDLINAIIPCYHLHEVLAEKFRALIQRSYTTPRDFYDIWYLSTTNQIVDWHAVKDAFFAKMEFKGLRFNGIDEMIRIENIKRFEADWNNSLGHHLPPDTLPNAKLVVHHIENLLKELFE